MTCTTSGVTSEPLAAWALKRGSGLVGEPVPKPFLLPKVPGHREGFTPFSFSQKTYSEFSLLLWGCLTHSQKTGLTPLASLHEDFSLPTHGVSGPTHSLSSSG